MLRFILNLESIFLNFYDFLSNLKNQFISKYFNDKILHLALYYNHSYITIYNYDSIYMLLYIWLFNLYNKYSMMYVLDTSYIDLGPDDLLLFSYVKNNKINRKIITEELRHKSERECEYEIKPQDPKFIYAIVDESLDMTQDFEDFKDFILLNKKLSVYDIVFIMSSFNKIKFNKNKNFNLKIMLDNNYDELVFKAEDLLLINT